jgi:hypothetical protein
VTRPSILLFAAALALAPMMARATPPDRPAAASKSTPARRPASAAELERYAEREKDAKDLERFEGGRIAETTIVIVLLLLIVLIIIL